MLWPRRPQLRGWQVFCTCYRQTRLSLRPKPGVCWPTVPSQEGEGEGTVGDTGSRIRAAGSGDRGGRPRPRRTYSGSRAGCAVGRGLGTRLRAAARPRAAPAAPHRPPPSEGPPSPPSSPELLRRGWRSLYFRLARGVPGKSPRQPPHNLFSGFLPGARSQPAHPSGHAQDSRLRPHATVARRSKIHLRVSSQPLSEHTPESKESCLEFSFLNFVLSSFFFPSFSLSFSSVSLLSVSLPVSPSSP